jgi:polyketide synthase-like dehydratase family protein
VLERTDERLVVGCQLADEPRGGWGGELHSPVLGDLLLQAACLLAGDRTGMACLPLAVARWQYFAPLPDDAPFTLVAEVARVTPAATLVGVTAHAEDGSPLARLTDVSAVGAVDLGARFARAVTNGQPA